ncbi:MAG TPA: hypothetical protein VIJ27_03045, partial [Mucilaginibacter sp.]
MKRIYKCASGLFLTGMLSVLMIPVANAQRGGSGHGGGGGVGVAGGFRSGGGGGVGFHGSSGLGTGF